MQQHTEMVAAGNLCHYRHYELVVVVGKVTFLKNRCQLELVRRDFVVAGLCRNSEFVRFNLEVKHECFHS